MVSHTPVNVPVFRGDVIFDEPRLISDLVRHLQHANHVMRGRCGRVSQAPLDDCWETVMPDTKTLHDAFVDELRDLYDAERQLTRALPKLAKAASSPDLREAFEAHLKETEGHVDRLEQVFASLDEEVRGKHCDGIAGIIEEGKAIIEGGFDESAMDASLIAAGQRAEHYEMAVYGTMVAWARAMGHDMAVELLEQTLEEEKAADEKLTSLADEGINQTAAELAHPAEDDEKTVGTSANRPTKGTKNRK